MIETILVTAAASGVVSYLAGRWVGGFETKRALKAAGNIQDQLDAATHEVEAKRIKLMLVTSQRDTARSERTQAEKMHRDSADELNRVWARINAAKALVTPHANSSVHRIMRALDGNTVSDRAKQLRDELVSANG